METRPPVVSVMGHIDHGKSTLIDYIRNSDIVSGEAGGITQHVGAYEVWHKMEDGHLERITFIDTPGHAAFAGVRTRGAQAADVAILIVSAEEGVKPQTKEALEQIRTSETPFIVAITKIDKPQADVMRTKQSLAENEILVEGYGGDIPVVALSAKTGEGVKELLDMILLVRDIENLTGDKDMSGSGVIIESRLDQKRGITAIGVIKNGVVRRGMFAATAGATAPLRFILNADGVQEEELAFSSPIQIIGWDTLPEVGREFKTFLKKSDAEEYAESEKMKDEKEVVIPEGVATLPLIIKADTAGSLEAINFEISKLSKERIVPKIILSAVGSVNEKDVKLALTTSGTTIISFNVRTDAQARALAERSGTAMLDFNLIYELTDKVDQLLTERTPKMETEELIGSAKVLKLFSINKDKQVLGARVQTGTFKQGALVKIMRREAEIGKGRVKELQQAKVATDSVMEGAEFGSMIESKTEIAPGDILEAIVVVTK